MPHLCTNCGRRFPDGSKEMLSGCPDCGGNKFQFQPKGRTAADSTPDAPPHAETDPATDASDSSADDPLSRSWPSQRETESDDADIIEPDPDPPPDSFRPEDHAQTDARSEVATRREVDDSADPVADRSDVSPSSSPDPPDADATVVDTPDDDRPDLADLRAELNDQFESIRVVNPGQYELNLMELYDREEYIISLREDGRYVI
ncbi:MAG: Zn-ribbon domain-containing protein, partial [Haloferacaceae archaeon]